MHTHEALPLILSVPVIVTTVWAAVQYVRESRRNG